MPFPGPDPGKAAASVQRDHLQLANDVMAVSWTIVDNVVTPNLLTNRINDTTLKMDGELFELLRPDGGRIRASDMHIVGSPRVDRLAVEPTSPKLANHFGGRQISVDLEDASGNLAAQWCGELRDGSNYVRQIVTLSARRSNIPIQEIVLVDIAEPNAERAGTVDGSPVVAGQFFFGGEHPMARNTAGFPSKEIGTWEPSQVSFPDHTQLQWDVTDHVDDIGTYESSFEYSKGDHRLEIFRVALLADDREVDHDDHFGATGVVHVDNRYVLNLAHHAPRATYTLVAEVRSDGGTDSHGAVFITHRKGTPRIRAAIPRNTSLSPGESITESSVVGVVPEGQLRRGFLYYVERQRAHPYRPFLHYNSWYDIGYFSKFDEADCLRVVNTFGTELVEKRGAVLDSFLFDDGWDDHESLWSFHEGLPRGFTPIQEATASYDASPGVWLSPWGGYGKPRKQRLTFGEAAGYETNEKGFVLSAPKYYERFREICLKMIRDFGVNQFKFDGIGRAGGRYPGSAFGSDFLAAIELIRDLRQAKPDVYINLTTGTWPSPFWLQHADSIWRGGYDHEFTGDGSHRQQWMTYRDAMTYQNVVRPAPLFPLSSLMLHGIIYAKHARQLNTDPSDDLRDEILTAFGCGTQLQEMYISPDLLTQENWDDLARSARWARNNADTLRDTHWIGGDPARSEVYGWASWSPAKGILVLRNPAKRVQTYEVDVAHAFELPQGASRRYRLDDSFGDGRIDGLEVLAGETKTITLQPFEVLVCEATAF